MGYSRAGFDVTGVDIKPQPRYPFAFILGDALEYVAAHGREYDVIHASPPCQAYSAGKNMWKGRLPNDRHPDLVSSTRALLSGVFVIENVIGAPLINPITLCGDAFALGVKRHRLFESSAQLARCRPCRPRHPDFIVSVFGGGALSRTPAGGTTTKGVGNFMQRRTHVPVEVSRRAMGIDWMTRGELSQAIPPVYTEFIGKQLIAALA